MFAGPAVRGVEIVTQETGGADRGGRALVRRLRERRVLLSVCGRLTAC